jgi:hypothetical protein
MTTDTLASRPRWTTVAFAIAVIAAVVSVAFMEWPRIEALLDAGMGPAAWLTDMRLDSTPFAVLLCLLPVFLLVRKPLFRLPRRIAAAVDSFSRDWEALRRGALLSEDSESQLNVSTFSSSRPARSNPRRVGSSAGRRIGASCRRQGGRRCGDS